MKKIIVLIMIAILCVSLCSCMSLYSRKDASIVPRNMNESNDGIAAQEEASNAMFATAAPTAVPTENAPVLYTTVEITIDNWQDYFELETVTCWNANDFGETTSTSIYTFFCVKDEYADHILWDSSEVILESCSYWSLASVDYDLESKTMGEIAYFEPASEGILIGERTHFNTYTLNSFECILPSELIGDIFQYIPESALCAWYTGYVPDELYDGVDNQKGYSFFDYSISRIQGSIIYVK